MSGLAQSQDAAAQRSGVVREIGWTVLGALLAALLAAAWLHDRADWPGLVAGEATYLMQADSLLRDRDLTYTRPDFDRLLLRWHRDPTDLELVSGGAGRITFDRPFPYALYLAPFVAYVRTGDLEFSIDETFQIDGQPVTFRDTARVEIAEVEIVDIAWQSATSGSGGNAEIALVSASRLSAKRAATSAMPW